MMYQSGKLGKEDMVIEDPTTERSGIWMASSPRNKRMHKESHCMQRVMISPCGYDSDAYFFSSYLSLHHICPHDSYDSYSLTR